MLGITAIPLATHTSEAIHLSTRYRRHHVVVLANNTVWFIPPPSPGLLASGSLTKVKGGIKITTVDGEIVQETAHGQAPIPAEVQMASFELRRPVELVLLIEKEAIFRRLDLGERMVVVTGKGYPDVATRELLATLSNMGTPVFALVDLDLYRIRSWQRCSLAAKPWRTMVSRCAWRAEVAGDRLWGG